MKKITRGDLIQTGIAVLIAAAFIKAGVVPFPSSQPQQLFHPPVLVYSEPMLRPLIVRAERKVPSKKHNPFSRAPVGQIIPVSLTQYCLKGTTRRDNYVREGIVAADPRVFPLARYVEVFVGKKYLGRFLVDDTGGKIKGQILDIWTPSCADAIKFGRRKGTAILVAHNEPEKSNTKGKKSAENANAATNATPKSATKTAGLQRAQGIPSTPQHDSATQRIPD